MHQHTSNHDRRGKSDQRREHDPAIQHPAEEELFEPERAVSPPAEMACTPQSKRTKSIVAAVVVLLLMLGCMSIGTTAYRTQQRTVHVHATATAFSAQESRQAHVHSTAMAIASTYPFSTHLVLSDPLTTNQHTEYGWDDDGTHCSFADNAYHDVDQPSSLYQTCAALHTDFTNFTFAIDMTMQEGDEDAYSGIVFRADEESDRYYVLAITPRGGYSLVVLYNHQQGDGLLSGQVPSFHQGLHQTNTLSVVARANQLSFYVNHQLLTSLSENRYQHGEIGVYTQAGQSETNVAYAHATVWQLP